MSTPQERRRWFRRLVEFAPESLLRHDGMPRTKEQTRQVNEVLMQETDSDPVITEDSVQRFAIFQADDSTDCCYVSSPEDLRKDLSYRLAETVDGWFVSGVWDLETGKHVRWLEELCILELPGGKADTPRELLERENAKMRKALQDIGRRISEYDRQCNDAGETDTGEAWDVFEWVKRSARSAARRERSAKATA